MYISESLPGFVWRWDCLKDRFKIQVLIKIQDQDPRFLGYNRSSIIFKVSWRAATVCYFSLQIWGKVEVPAEQISVKSAADPFRKKILTTSVVEPPKHNANAKLSESAYFGISTCKSNCHMNVIFLDFMSSRWHLSHMLAACISSVIPEQYSECSSLKWQN